MKVQSVEHKYREVGISLGLPCYFVKFGPGTNLEVEDLAKKLLRMGITHNRWLIAQGDIDREQQMSTFIDAMRTFKVKTEVEVRKSLINTPPWFPKAHRWVVYWTPEITFNLGSLRPNQDMILYEGTDYDAYFKAAEEAICLKGIVAEDPHKIWETVRLLDVRVYRKVL